MSGELLLRSARPADHAAILALAAEAFRSNSFTAALVARFGELEALEPTELVRSGITERLASEGTTLVAELNGQLVGFVMTECNAARSTGGIPVLAVEAAHRRIGVGRAMIDAALAQFRERGLRYARIETLATNEASQRLFVRAGFAEFAREVQFFRRLDP